MSPGSLLSTGKDGYSPDREFDERERDDRLFFRYAVEVESFARELPAIAPILAARRGYRLLDLGRGYGRLAPFLSAFDCTEYLGLDRVRARIEYARARYGGGICRFEVADILTYRTRGLFDVVWSSTVMQHMLLDDKLRLVETMKLALVPSGAVLLREGEIASSSREELERRYARAEHARHMVPIPFQELASAFRPLRPRRLRGIIYIAEHERYGAPRAQLWRREASASRPPA